MTPRARSSGTLLSAVRSLVAAVTVLLALAFLSACRPGAAAGPTVRRQDSPRRAATGRPNIILIMTDDQRWDSIVGESPGLSPAAIMPHVQELLVGEGVLFTRAFVSNPVCCPSRASLWSGGFSSHHTGVLTNHYPNGGALRFHDEKTLATLLRRRGYRTIFIGRYLNEYEHLTRLLPADSPGLRGGYIPPGWNAFIAYSRFPVDWYDYSISAGSSSVDGPSGGILLPDETAAFDAFIQDSIDRGFPAPLARGLRSIDFGRKPHISEIEARLSSQAIDAAAEEPARPFFLILSTAAPHGPATPVEADEDRFPDFAYRGRAWGEEDLSDKPSHIREKAKKFDDIHAGIARHRKDGRSPDQFYGDQLRSLQAIDRTVAELVRRVESNPQLRERTVFIYTSDHGMQWGEHKLLGDKKLPYEESIRVPLVIRMPGVPKGVISQMVASDLDLGATILHLAGYSEAEIREDIRSDVHSLLPILRGEQRQLRSHLLLQDFGSSKKRQRGPAWVAIRNERWKYILYDTQEEELYDLRRDPFEMTSLHDREDQRAVIARLAPLMDDRGLIISQPEWRHPRLPPASPGRGYRLQLQAVGGEPPYSWFDRTGKMFSAPPDECTSGLPPGLTLGQGGLISGIPLKSGCFQFAVVVEDSSISPQHGGPQSYARVGRIRVRDAE